MLPFAVCDPLEPKTCYGIRGTAQVEESLDGGVSWAIAWSAPADREDFRNKLAGGLGISCGKIPDVHTFDLVFYPGQKGSTLLVAMGNEGLLVHPPHGGWQAVGITSAPGVSIGVRIIPTPFTASNPGDAIDTTTTEFLLAATAGLLAWSILSIWMRRKILRRIGTTKKSKIIFIPTVIALVLTLLIPAAMVYLMPRNSIILLSGPAFLFWVVLGAVAVWHFSTFHNDIPAELRKIDRYVFLCGTLVFVAGWLPMGLWAYGIIETNITAQILSIESGLAVLVLGIFWLNRRINADYGNASL
jgi:hypothetical protein